MKFKCLGMCFNKAETLDRSPSETFLGTPNSFHFLVSRIYGKFATGCILSLSVLYFEVRHHPRREPKNATSCK